MTLITIIIVIPLSFWHKLNYYSYFCQTFEKLLTSCAKILINLKVQLSRFELQTFQDNDIELKQSKHLRLFHNINEILFFIFYNHYLPIISKLKNLGAKVRILNLNNYLIVCCQNGKGIMVRPSKLSPLSNNI